MRAVAITTAEIVRFVDLFAERIHAARDELTALDSAIGDADHGINMDRGMTAVHELLPSLADGDAGSLFKQVGMKLISTVGGASGPLYGTFFLRLGTSLAGATDVTPEQLAEAFKAGLDFSTREMTPADDAKLVARVGEELSKVK